MDIQRRYPIGAEPNELGTHFRVWAPKRRRVTVVMDSVGGLAESPLSSEERGYHSGFVADVQPQHPNTPNTDAEAQLYPDPASRFQPHGPFGSSQVVDPGRFSWTDRGWKGISLAGQVLYEMHIGTFTKEGTWRAAMAELPELAALGISCLELMPVADFPGDFGWGYDGVNLFAPSRLYGEPDDFRRFVDSAHHLGIGVILDVVYNHFGPNGNFLEQFAKDYFSEEEKTDWGKAIRFHGPNSEPVREYFTTNADYWIEEYHLDGFRLDATQNIYDKSKDHIIAVIARTARRSAGDRRIIVIAENEPQDVQLLRNPVAGGFGLDGVWNDDFHHTAIAALTGRTEAYYKDYRGSPQEFISSAKYGYLYQGQWYSWQKKHRGRPGLDLDPSMFINFIQNHDQIANSGRGLRIHQLSQPSRFRAMTALLLLGPGTPLLFQGQEFLASSPFHYFADHEDTLHSLIENGRAMFLQQFRSLTDPMMREVFARPHDPKCFERCKLDFREREHNAAHLRLTRDLLRLRRETPAFAVHKSSGIDGAVLSASAFVLRYFAEDGNDRLMVVNFGPDLHLETAPEPLLAPPEGKIWSTALSTENPIYGGCGAAPLETEDEGWRIPAESATVLAPQSEFRTVFAMFGR